jgi:hypothetical protein
MAGRRNFATLLLIGLIAGCSPGRPAVVLQPVAGDGWRNFQAVLAGTVSDPAAGYDGVYPTRRGAVPFRIEVRAPRLPLPARTTASVLGVVPTPVNQRWPYVVVRILTASDSLPVAAGRIVPVAPCGPPGTPSHAISVGVQADAAGTQTATPPRASPFRLIYSHIFVHFDSDPEAVASCGLDFTRAIGDGSLPIPPLRLVNRPSQAYAAEQVE